MQEEGWCNKMPGLTNKKNDGVRLAPETHGMFETKRNGSPDDK